MDNIKVFTLKHDSDHSEDSERDAFLVEYDGSINLPYYIIDCNTYSKDRLPRHIYFQANFNLILNYDYPYTDIRVPICSQAMLSVLFNFKNFEYTQIPVTMLDDSFIDGIYVDGKIKPEIRSNDNYSVLRLEELQSNYLDLELSSYKMSRRIEGKLGLIKHLVLKEPITGFPAIFRIKEKASALFVSAEAKEALEKAGIKGCIFEPVETS